MKWQKSIPVVTWLKGKYSFLPVIGLNILLLLIGFFAGEIFPAFRMTREKATDLQKDILSDFISLLGIGLAVLAVLLAIIQLAYKRLNVIRLVITNTYFAPLVYFGLLNILISALNYLYNTDPTFIHDHLFIRVAVMETYLFVVFSIFVAFVFFKVFTYSNFSKITDLYLDNIRSLVLLEKKNNVDNDGAEFLQSAGSELKSEIDASIDESRITVIDKIFDLYLFVQHHNPQSNILRGLKIFLQSWLLESYSKRNINILHNLVGNWRELFKEAIQSGDKNQIGVFRFFASELYQFKGGEEGMINRKVAIDFFPIRLKELGMTQIWQAKPTEGSFEEIRSAYSSIQPILNEFSELIKAAIEAHDLNGLQQCLQEFKSLIGDFDLEHKYSELKMQIKFAEAGVTGFQPLDDRTQLRFDLHGQLQAQKFSVVFSNLAWLYYQILEGKRTFSPNKEIIELLSRYLPTDNTEVLPLAANIINQTRDEFGWGNWIWNNEERLSGEAYFLPLEQMFLAIGLIAVLAKNGLNSAPSSEFDKSFAAQVRSVFHWVGEAIKNYANKEAEWAMILKIPESEVKDMLLKIEEYFKGFEGVREQMEQEDLAKSPLSIFKVEAFRQKMFDQWNQSNTLTRVFEYYHAVDRKPDEKLMHVGMMRIHFEKAKFLFTEIHHHEIHGLEWGYEVNTGVANFFMERIKEAAIPTTTASSYVDAMDNLPKEINMGGGHIILFHSFISSWAIQRALESTGNYKAAGQFSGESFPFEFTGVYRNNIVLVPIRSVALKDKVIIMNLPGAITLKRREDEQWMDKLLQVDVIEVDETNARRLAEKKYPGKEITQPLLNEMLAGIFIEINETMNFDIVDKKQIAVYTLTNAQITDD